MIALIQKLQYIALSCILAVCIAAFSVMTAKSFYYIDTMASNLSGHADRTIVIDAGHGGEDSGAVSGSGLYEKDVNLAIAKQVGEMLELSGYPVIMTREEDISIHNEGLSTVRERKVSDLHNRLKIVQEQGENCVLISIHQNHFSESKYFGAQVFYSPNNADSSVLAEAIRSQVTSLTQPDNHRKSKPATNSIYLLWNAEIPAVIVECGFLSNPEEAQKLSESRYQQQLAFSIYTGIVEYLADS